MGASVGFWIERNTPVFRRFKNKEVPSYEAKTLRNKKALTYKAGLLKFINAGD
jgi:hypothetical protein